MSIRLGKRIFCRCFALLFFLVPVAGAASGGSWNGVLNDGAGKPIAGATVRLHPLSGGSDYAASTAANGTFAVSGIALGTYEVSITLGDKSWRAALPLEVKDGAALKMKLQLSLAGAALPEQSAPGQELRMVLENSEIG